MTTRWLHNNRVHRYAKVHRSDCTFCADGKGLHDRGDDAVATEWLGPFASNRDAELAARGLGREASRCAACSP